MKSLYNNSVVFRFFVNFCIGGVFFGFGIPNVITAYHYFFVDGYEIISPVSTNDTEYNPCEDILLSIQRSASIESDAEFVFRLERLDKPSQFIVLREFEGFIKPGEGTIPSKVTLPCDIAEGEYTINGIVQYTVYGIDKQELFDTNSFFVKNAD